MEKNIVFQLFFSTVTQLEKLEVLKKQLQNSLKKIIKDKSS